MELLDFNFLSRPTLLVKYYICAYYIIFTMVDWMIIIN